MASGEEDLDRQLLQLVAHHAGCPVTVLRPWTHIVFDLGIDGEDVDDLIDDIERTFAFTATDAEWRSPSSLGDLDAMVKRLRGFQRPEVIAGRKLIEASVRRRIRFITTTVAAWLLVGVGAYFFHRPTFLAWVVLSVGVAGSTTVREAYQGIRAYRQWRRERRARYGV